MKTLILFSSRDGQTREIAEFVAAELKARGVESEVCDLHHVNSVNWACYDRVVIGASVRYGRFHPALIRFIQQQHPVLNSLPGAFFSVSLTARKPEKRTPQTNAYTRKLLMSSAWHPDLTAVFAGALRYPHYRWLDRMMIRLIMRMSGGETNPHKEVVYTDWVQVADFAREIAQLTHYSSVVRA